MEQLRLFKDIPELSGKEWIAQWAKDHNYPAIMYQFGRKGFYLKYGLMPDTWIYGKPGKGAWDKFQQAPDLFVDVAIQVLKLEQYQSWDDWEKYDVSYGWKDGKYTKPQAQLERLTDVSL